MIKKTILSLLLLSQVSYSDISYKIARRTIVEFTPKSDSNVTCVMVLSGYSDSGAGISCFKKGK